MQRRQAMKYSIFYFLTLAFLFCSAPTASAAELTQRDWMITLVDAAGWSYGLPDEPQDPDYINILSGNREFRFEAEDVFSKDEDNVSLMSFRDHGAFSGRGWLHGTRNPTDVHLRFNLPVGGEYVLKAHLRQAGHLFAIAATEQTVGAGSEFTETMVGTFQLQAGSQEIVVTLPPDGSIDYITLNAPNLATITPVGGWQPDEPLRWEAIQTTLLQLWHLADFFPTDPDPLVFEAEDLDQTDAKVVTIQHLGNPSGGKWLRSDAEQVDVRFPINLKQGGFYDLSLRALGNPINITIGNHQHILLEAKPYLENVTFKSVFLFAGESYITLRLPPGGGVDLLSLSGRQIDSMRASNLFGFELAGLPQAQDLDKLSTLLAAFGVER